MQLEFNGTNVIAEGERSGKASSLFWPWAGANVSLLALSYGSFFLGFGISFWQATLAALLGTTLSFLLVGFSSLAGKKSNAPTMVLSRAVFGVKGNVVPGLMSYLVFVGWETVLVSLATLATGTIFMRIGDIDRNLAMVIGFVVAVSLTMYGGVLGHKVIMRLQKYLTLVTSFATLIYILLTFDEVSWDKVSEIPSGNIQAFIGALIFGITGIGLGWVNTAADYSRYLPRTTSSKSVVGWTVLGASIVPIILVIYGAALSGSDPKLSEAIAMDPIGALTGLDIPEVSMIAILDADKEGFLRSTRSLIQIIGRAARHSEGQVIMYADKQTDSMKGAIEETNRRRDKQIAYNLKHNITPISIKKEIHSPIHSMDDEILKLAKTKGKSSRSEIEQRVKEFEKLMREAAKVYDFERAAELRDIIFELKAEIKA
jgi:hypothetical protein